MGAGTDFGGFFLNKLLEVYATFAGGNFSQTYVSRSQPNFKYPIHISGYLECHRCTFTVQHACNRHGTN